SVKQALKMMAAATLYDAVPRRRLSSVTAPGWVGACLTEHRSPELLPRATHAQANLALVRAAAPRSTPRAGPSTVRGGGPRRAARRLQHFRPRPAAAGGRAGAAAGARNPAHGPRR